MSYVEDRPAYDFMLIHSLRCKSLLVFWEVAVVACCEPECSNYEWI